MSDCFVLYLLLTCMKKKTSGADKFTNNIQKADLLMPPGCHLQIGYHTLGVILE